MVWRSGRNTGNHAKRDVMILPANSVVTVSKCSTCATAMLTVNADAGSEDAGDGRCKCARRISNGLPAGHG